MFGGLEPPGRARHCPRKVQPVSRGNFVRATFTFAEALEIANPDGRRGPIWAENRLCRNRFSGVKKLALRQKIYPQAQRYGSRNYLTTPLQPSARSRAEHLGDHFASRDPLHLARWSAALAAGRARKRCSATTKTGAQCRQIALRFATTCRHHTRGRARDGIDALRLGWLRKQALRHPALRAYAERSIERIFTRRLLRAWRLDPELPARP